MKRLTENRDLFEAAAGEVITVTVKAQRIPYQVTFSTLDSGGQWTVVQVPTPQVPVEIRTLTMPASKREFFTIVYAFPPAVSTDGSAKYRVSFSGVGASDGPNSVVPLSSGDIDDLPYEFRLPAAKATDFMTHDLAAAVAVTPSIAAASKTKHANRN